MTERRGHRKLRLCSNKHYEQKKYFPKKLLVSIPKTEVSIPTVSVPLHLVQFNVSVPLTMYKKFPAPSLEIMHSRIQQLRILSNGTVVQVLLLLSIFLLY